MTAAARQATRGSAFQPVRSAPHASLAQAMPKPTASGGRDTKIYQDSLLTHRLYSTSGTANHSRMPHWSRERCRRRTTFQQRAMSTMAVAAMTVLSESR